MAKTKKELPLAPLERILKKAGAKRVSKEALKEFSSVLSDYVYDISAEAATLAKHAGRTTIIDKDIKMVRRKMG